MNRIKEIKDLLESVHIMDNNYLISNNDVWHLLITIESQKEEIERLREVQKVLVLTPMQRMTQALEKIEDFSGGID